MKAIRIVLILLLFATASAAYVWLRSFSETPSGTETAMPNGRQTVDRMEMSVTNEAPVPVQPLEERGDAMLFEVEALQNTPFDDAIVKPFD